MITWEQLTVAEQEVLRKLFNGVVRGVGSYPRLVEIGLIEVDADSGVHLTMSGHELTAAQQPATAQPEAEGGVDYQTMWFSVARQLAELRVDYDELSKEFEEMPPLFTFDEQKKEIGHLRDQLAASRKREAALRAVLEFYADPKCYEVFDTTYSMEPDNIYSTTRVEEDHGKRAAEALQAAGESGAKADSVVYSGDATLIRTLKSEELGQTRVEFVVTGLLDLPARDYVAIVPERDTFHVTITRK